MDERPVPLPPRTGSPPGWLNPKPTSAAPNPPTASRRIDLTGLHSRHSAGPGSGRACRLRPTPSPPTPPGRPRHSKPTPWSADGRPSLRRISLLVIPNPVEDKLVRTVMAGIRRVKRTTQKGKDPLSPRTAAQDVCGCSRRSPSCAGPSLAANWLRRHLTPLRAGWTAI